MTRRGHDWKLILRTGFGNIFDIGYGWDYEGQCLVAAAINADTKIESDLAWEKVKKYCRTKGSGSIAAC